MTKWYYWLWPPYLVARMVIADVNYHNAVQQLEDDRMRRIVREELASSRTNDVEKEVK